MIGWVNIDILAKRKSNKKAKHRQWCFNKHALIFTCFIQNKLSKVIYKSIKNEN